MSEPPHSSSVLAEPAQWDARLARRLVHPLRDGRVTPNHLTTVRLMTGLAGAAAFIPGTYGWCNLGALLVMLSNFLDHADGELARISGKGSRFGHLYDLASDALITVLLFLAMGMGARTAASVRWSVSPVILGALAGSAIAVIFFLRMRIESLAGKAATRQSSRGGFETEDVLYLLPLVTLCDGVVPLLIAASIGAPLFALWVIRDYHGLLRGRASMARSAPGPGLG
jgi:archaetidylinositol phosphate synthase